MTAIAALAPMAASTALPPWVNTSMAAWVAAWSAVAAIARKARTGAAGTRKLIGGDPTGPCSPAADSGCHPRSRDVARPDRSTGDPGRRSWPPAPALAIVGALLPWLRTGGRSRNSFDLFRIVGDLGFAPDGAAAAVIRGWPIVPLLAVVGVVAAWWGWARRRRRDRRRSPPSTPARSASPSSTAPTRGRVLARAIGPTVATIGGVVLLAGSIAVLVVGRAVTSPTPTAAPARPSGSPGGRS